MLTSRQNSFDGRVHILPQLGNDSGHCKCGIFDTGFAGSFYDPSCWATVLDNGKGGEEGAAGGFVATKPLDWPVLYAAGI
jgi:hypothetical protein